MGERMALPSCNCEHVDYCGKCMREERWTAVKPMLQQRNHAHDYQHPQIWACPEHGFLNEDGIIRVYPDGHECGYA